MAAETKKTRRRGPIPLNLPDDLRNEIEETADGGGVSEQDVIRLALVRGLPKVKDFLFIKKTKAA